VIGAAERKQLEREGYVLVRRVTLVSAFAAALRSDDDVSHEASISNANHLVDNLETWPILAGTDLL
jgi:hypothetical protein